MIVFFTLIFKFIDGLGLLNPCLINSAQSDLLRILCRLSMMETCTFGGN